MVMSEEMDAKYDDSIWKISRKKVCIIASLLLIVTTPFVAGNSCFKFITQASFRFSGEVATSPNFDCGDVCNRFKSAPTPTIYTIAVKLNNLCFCGNVTDHDNNALSVQCQSQSCNSLTDSCQMVGFSKTTVPAVYPTLTTDVSTFVVGKNNTVSVNGVEGVFKLDYNFGDGYKYMSDKINVAHLYLTPGYFYMRIGVVKENSTRLDLDKWNKVERSEISNIEFDVPGHFETGVSVNTTLLIGGGEDMNMTIEMKYDSYDVFPTQVPSEIVVADVSTIIVGPAISDNAPVATFSLTDKLIVVPSLSFSESGSITGFEFHALKIGILSIYVLRPDTCLICNEKSNLNSSTTTSSVRITDSTSFTIVKVVLIDVKEIGFQLHPVRTNDIKVKEGDMLAVTQLAASTSATLKYAVKDSMRHIAFQSSMVQGSTVGTFPSTDEVNNVPHIRPYLSKAFAYKFDVPCGKNTYDCFERVGNFTFTAKNGSTIIATKTVPVHKRITDIGFEFIENGVTKVIGPNEKNPTIPTYKSEGTTIELKAYVEKAFKRILKRTDVLYKFTVLRWSDQIEIISTNFSIGYWKNFKFTQAYWKPGIYQIICTAKNLIDSINKTTVFEILDDIDDLKIETPGQIQLNKKFTLKVNVFNGTNVTAQVNFDSAKAALDENKKYIVDASNGKGIMKVNHTYTKCGIYDLEATAKNDITKMLTRTIKVNALCEIKNITVQTIPKENADTKQIKISGGEKLTLLIKIRSGSYANYTINWGDGRIQNVDNTKILDPVLVEVEHEYHKDSAGMNYNITVNVANMINEAWWAPHLGQFYQMVKLQNCSEPPDVKFPYGSITNPYEFTVGERREFIGTWSYATSDCKTIVSPNIKLPLTCKLYEETVLNSRIFDKVSPKEPKIIPSNVEDGWKCTLEPRTLDIKDYKLVLVMRYGKDPLSENDYQYPAYIRVKRSNLTAIIKNGEFRAVPEQKRLTKEGRPEYYNFVLDGSDSQDPDDAEKKTSGLTFSWSCRYLHGGVNNTNSSAYHFCNTNSTKTNPTGEEWIKIDKNQPESTGCSYVDTGNLDLNMTVIKINTSCFRVNGFYSFKLLIEKDDGDGGPKRKREIYQEVELTEGEPPEVSISCVTNCNVKVNAKEKYVVRYKCDSCFGRRLVAKWTIIETSKKKVIPYDGTSGANLVIESNFLEEGKQYNFNLTTRYEAGERTSTVTLKKTTSKKPFGGKCEIDPPQGEASITRFTINCEDWKFDDYLDKPTTYEFRYRVKEELSGDLPLLNPDSLDRAQVGNVLLPEGLKERNNTINIVVRIINQFGAFAEWLNSTVKVKTPAPPEPPAGAASGNASESAIKGMEKKLLENKPKNENDTQAMTAFVNSAISVITNVEVKKEVVNPVKPTVDPGAFGGVQIDKDAQAAQKKKEEEAKKQKTEFKDSMVKILKKVPVKNIQQLKAVADSLQTVTAEKDEVSDSTQDNAIDMLFNMKDVLKNVANDKKVGADYLEASTKNYVNSISNLFKVETTVKKETKAPAAKKPEETKPDPVDGKTGGTDAKGTGGGTSGGGSGKTDPAKPAEPAQPVKPAEPVETEEERKAREKKEREEKAKKSKSNVGKLVSTLNVYFDVISQNKVPGEKPSRGKTDSFDFALKKVSAADFANVSMLEESDVPENETDPTKVKYGFVLPNMTGFFDRQGLLESNEEINMENVNFKTNIYSWDLENSKNIKSEVASLSLKKGGGPMNVSNLENPITFNIKNKKEDLIPRNVSLWLPGDLMFNETKITDVKCNMLINIGFINDFDNKTQFIVHIQYGHVASSDDYDVKLNISQEYGIIMTKGEFAKELVPIEVTNKTLNGTNKAKCNMTAGNDTVTRFVDAHIIDNSTILLSGLDKYHWADACVEKKLHVTYQYHGPMPQRIFQENDFTDDIIEYRGAYNFSVRSFCADCAYWYDDGNTSKWLKDGCHIDPDQTSLQTTSCACNHLTAFGGFLVAPNPLKTPTLAMLKEGYVLLVTVGTILLLYIVGIIIARRADEADLKKIGVCPLLDNDPNDRYLYEITVNTGSRRNAGTKSNVFFNASGDIGDSGTHHLRDPERDTFQANSSDVFIMATPNTIGDINYIRVWHDNTGGGWYLRSIEIIDLQTEEKYMFITTRWLAVDKHDGMLDALVPVCGKEELSDFNYLFTSKSKRELSDAHIWFSIYARPPRSSFTRCQRLSVAISLLFCSMLSSCMFYQAGPPRNPVDENRIGGFSFTWSQVFIALISACITVPINLILVGLFRIINPTPPGKKLDGEFGESENSGSNTEMTMVDNPSGGGSATGTTKLIDEDSPPNSAQKKDGEKKKRKKAFYLPHWCIYPTWVFCILVILGSGFLVVWYGMTFGNKKSLDWLASVTICLVQDILLIQPLKVFAMALFIALIVKKLDEEEKSELEKNVKSLTKNESWLHKLRNEGTIFDRVEVIEPPDLSVLDNMRAVRLKEMKMAAISREMMLYFLYTIVVFMIGFNMRDQNAYGQTKDIKELFKLSIRNPSAEFEKSEVFSRLQSYQEFWDWADVLLLPELYPKKWFNLSEERFPPDNPLAGFPGRIYLNDLNSKIVNGVRLRQMRVTRSSCDKAPDVKGFIKIDCADAYSSFNEEKGDYNYNWTRKIPGGSKESLSPVNKPWRYQDSSELDTFMIMAKLNTYIGGGYVVELFPKWQNKLILDQLRERQWIDRHTRALIVEFATYNAQTNYFDMVMIVFEFPPSGGLVHYSSVESFRLSLYTNETAFFVIGCFVLYLLFMFVFTIREVRILYRIGWKYFRDFWNLVEMGNIALSLIGIFIYFYLNYLRKKLLSRLPHKVPNVFINFHSASMWYDMLIHIIALICFFVTLKFIKILRFNKRISMLSSTLKVAWYPLAMFGIMFFIIIFAVVFSATIIFGHTLYGYRNWWGTMSAVFSLLLGKFSYNQFESTNIILGPIFFFSFNIMVNWIIMNMFISILNDVFACVQAEILEQENEYEMFDYMMGHVKGWLGFKSKLVENEQVAEEKMRLQEEKMNRSGSASNRSSLRLKHSGSESSLNKSQHWRAEKLFVDDSKFLMEENVSEKFVDETVEKFVQCINLLYFNDINAGRKISKFARSEMNDL